MLLGWSAARRRAQARNTVRRECRQTAAADRERTRRFIMVTADPRLAQPLLFKTLLLPYEA